MLILNATEVRQALPMAAAIGAMREAFAALTQGRAQVPARIALGGPDGGTTLVMPALLDAGDSRALTVKAVSVFPANRAKNLPLIHAAVLVIDPETGKVDALLEGGALTAIRTGAASGLATDLLAQPGSRVAAIFGSGKQARTQLEAVCTVRPIKKVWVCSPTPGHAEAFAEQVAGRGWVPPEVSCTRDSREAVAVADVICTATTSPTPVFDDRDLKPGVHINAVGSFQPHIREVPGETVARSRIFVDSREAALEEAGDILQAIDAGLISAADILAEIGELVLGQADGRTANGRTADDQITFFKSVGVAVQDAAAARVVLESAARMGLGQTVDW